MTPRCERPSLRARLVAAFVRAFLKPRSRREPDPKASRAFVERFATPALLAGARITPARVGGIAGEWVGSESRRDLLLYVHGGAFVVCSPATHRPITSAFARRGFRVFCPAYRRAPEYRFPAALDDVVAAYRGLIEIGADPARMALAGDSAGGGLVLSCLVRLRELGLPLPAAAALFSPWTDLAGTGESMRLNGGRDPLFYPDHVASVAAHYLADASPTEPLASPLYADLTGLPALLIHVGEPEVLLDDSRRVAAKAEAAGVEVQLTVWPGVSHVWQMLALILPEARRSIDEAASFLRARMREARRAA